MSTLNPRLQAALRYAELGYPVFPCVPGTKIPLTEHGFHDATIDPDQIVKWWTDNPGANVAIATEGLLVVDIDFKDNPWLAEEPEKRQELARGPMASTPRGGSHSVMRQPAAKHWRCSEGRLAVHVDVRADGGYILVAPSVSKDGHYTWVAGLDLDVPPERLPEPPAWLAEELDRLATRAPTLAFDATSSAESNEIPIAQDDVPSANVTDTTIDTNKIPTGQRNGTLARLGGTMRRVGMSKEEMFAALERANIDRCMPPLPIAEVERIAGSIARYEPDQVAVAMAENHWDQMYASQPVGSANGDPGPTPDELLQVPGFIDEVMAYTLETAPYPERALAFCGAITLQALLAGRKVRDESDNRTNLYVIGLANSGAGKDQPRKVNQRILIGADMSACLGDSFASGEGIEDRLFINPSMLFQTDEVDGLMTKINLGKDARHEGIMNVLLKMYSSANSIYPMRVKAGKEPTMIDQPCLSVFGTAIPKHYYEALAVKMLTNGFFARAIIVEAGRRGRGQDAIVRALPNSIQQTARWWAEVEGGNLTTLHPNLTVVEHSPDASQILCAFREVADREYGLAEDKIDPVGMAIWARANEKARKLALVYACSANHLNLRVSPGAAQWACAFVEHQTRRMLFMAAEHVSENEFDARCKKLIVTLRKWREAHGDAWMPFWQINRKHPWTMREHEQVRATLLSQELIEFDDSRTGGRPKKQYRMAAQA